jgi:hypothetical protein
MNLFFEQRFKKWRQHEFCNFEWWIFVSYEIQCCRIKFFNDFKIRHEFQNYCEIITKIWWIHNEFLKLNKSCSFKNEITHWTTTFIYNVRKLRFLASNAEIYNSWLEFKFYDHLLSKRNYFHNINWIYQCLIIQNTND